MLEEGKGRFLERRARGECMQNKGGCDRGWKRGWLYVRDGDYEL